MKKRKKKLGQWLALLLGMGIAQTADAELLTRSAVVDLAHGNYPIWYQDTNGLAVELCLDNNGLCVGTDLPEPPFYDPNLPLSFPDNWPSETFHYLAETDASFTVNGAGAIAIFAIEDAFFNEVPADGDQVVFMRIRIRLLNPPLTGTYTMDYPWGSLTFNCDAGATCTFTDDIGLAPLSFDGALAIGVAGSIGPFLLASSTPGGAALPFVVDPVSGNRYIANPAIPTKVTGGPVRNNVEIRDPNDVLIGSAEDFVLQGKLMGAQITPISHEYTPQSPATLSAPVTFTVANISQSDPLVIGVLALSGTDTANFVISADTCSNATIPAAAAPPAVPSSCTFDVQFSSVGADGAKSSTLNIPFSSPAGLPQGAIALSGEVNSSMPTVLSTFPAAGEVGVVTNSIITATLSEALDAASVSSASFSVAGAPGTVLLDAAHNTVVLLPSQALTANTLFTATLTTAITDVAGNPLETNVSFSFTTGASADAVAPVVSSNSPAADATAVALGSDIQIVFSKPMAAHSINSATILLNRGASTVGGTVSYDEASNTATLTPAGNLLLNSLYTATVTTGAIDKAQNSLSAAHVFSFVSDIAPIAPVLVSPENLEDDVETSVELMWEPAFDEDEDPLSYQVLICTNQFFLGCDPVDVAALVQPEDPLKNWGGKMGSGILAGLLLMGGIRKRKGLLALLLAVGIISSFGMISCKGGSDDDASADITDTADDGTGGNPIGDIGGGTDEEIQDEDIQDEEIQDGDGDGIPDDEDATLSMTVDGLTPGATYYWKVTVSDGKGGVTDSEIRSFTVEAP